MRYSAGQPSGTFAAGDLEDGTELRIRSLAALLSAAAVLSACGADPEPAARPVAPPAPAPAAQPVVPPAPDSSSVELDESPGIAKIKRNGRLMIGLPADAPQLATHDERGGHAGFDVELGRAVAGQLGLNPQTQVAFRWMPPTLREEAMTSGSVDLQMGGFDPATAGAATAGPYAVVGPPGHEQEQFLGFKPGDDKMREQVQQALDRAVADGSWQRAYDATLGRSGVPARPR